MNPDYYGGRCFKTGERGQKLIVIALPVGRVAVVADGP